MAILDASGAIVDMFGVAGEDGSGTGHEFENGRAERADTNTSGSDVWDEAGWNIDNDSGGGDGNQYAPEGFDPGAWIGAGPASDTCDDESACNTGADGACEYPDTGYDCDGNCVGEVDCAGNCGGGAVEDCSGECGGAAAVDDCGECGGSNDCFISVTFNVNMALEDVSEDGVALYGIGGDWTTGIAMTDGSGTFSATVSLAPESFHLYKFKNGGSYESVDELECAWFDDPDGDGFGYWDRYVNLTGVTEDFSLDSVCFGECGDCAVEITGCTDPLADNYNPDANVDDDSCEYSFADPANLFFSEVAEGSSNNKYLEIYNATDDDVDLGSYSLSSCSNGCDDGVSWDYPDNVSFDVGTILAAGDVYVVCHGSSDDLILAECDQTFTYLSNGDDVFGLTQIGSGILLDIIGTIGDDPGSGWEVAGVNNATKDHTLVRDSSVTSGNGGDWAASAGDADGSEWVVFDQNIWTYLGSHPHNLVSTCNDDTACNFGEDDDCSYPMQGYDCDGNPYIEVTFQVDMADQTVDTEGYGLDLYVDDPYGYHDMSDDDGDGVWSVTLTLAGNTEYHYKFKNGEVWENNFNDFGCGAGDEYGNRFIVVGDVDTQAGPFCFNSCSECVTPCSPGDVNGDISLDVLDVVIIVNYILENADYNDCADFNGDGTVNVLDIVAIVNGILNGRISDATKAQLIKNDNQLMLLADGFIGAVQLELRHNSDFEIELTNDAMVAEYRTVDKTTRIIIVAPESDLLFDSSGDYEIVDMIVADSGSEIETIVLNHPGRPSCKRCKSFKLSSAYPNPFNPSTTINLHVENEGLVKVSVLNMAGKEVAQLSNEFVEAGDHSMTWVADVYPSGVYLIRANMMGETSVQKVILLK
ncbi:MAG: T9SS type A sorting domain-containing protein [Candidatus Marinimicrobia bacterium]|nr:T9SS type A sorting domain-containing protein [Candidatus Neomarinimicrobiota bacterium]